MGAGIGVAIFTFLSTSPFSPITPFLSPTLPIFSISYRTATMSSPLTDDFASLRLMKDTTPFQRGIIRHLIVALDLSESMSEKDLRPTRYLRTILNMTAFVREFFEQNPISQLGIIGMRDGVAVRVSDISGNPEQHIAALTKLKDADPKGHPSLQNALEMSRGALL